MKNNNERDERLAQAAYVDPAWVNDNAAYYITQNGLGSYWPQYVVKATCGGWCPIVIRDSNPFKTLEGAIRFIDKQRARWNKK